MMITTILLYAAMVLAIVMAMLAMDEAGAIMARSRRAAFRRRCFGWASAAMAVLLAIAAGGL